MRRRELLTNNTSGTTKYLTFRVTSGTLKFNMNNLPSAVEYSTNGGITWTSISSSSTYTTDITEGRTIIWRGSLSPRNYQGVGTFATTGTGTFDVEGNPMSLLYSDNFSKQTDLTGKNYAFYGLFQNCTALTNADKLVLPATTLADNCYSRMFYACTSLTTAPELPATTLANTCYQYMFSGCRSLTTAPELPATTLANTCYQDMFSGCTSLTTAPELPATTLADNCYIGMFYACTSLTTAPELPATTLTIGCYYQMFQDCTSLTTAPELPATTLTIECYYQMFQDCTSLTTAPELPATTLADSCYNGMFFDCSNLNYIKCLATDISTYGCTSNWTYGVSSSGTFVKAASMNDWTRDENGIPDGWTVEDVY